MLSDIDIEQIINGFWDHDDYDFDKCQSYEDLIYFLKTLLAKSRYNDSVTMGDTCHHD